MAREYVSKEALCPFYSCETKQTITCEGITDNSVLKLQFVADCRQYKIKFCRSSWSKCSVAKMLWDKDE